MDPVASGLDQHLQTADMEVSGVQVKVTSLKELLDVAYCEGHMADEAPRLQSEVTELKQQLEVCQSKLQASQEEVRNQSEIIVLMTDSAKVHDSVISDLEGRIHSYEKELTKNEENMKSLTAALADQKTKNASLQDAVGNLRQQIQQLQTKDVDVVRQHSSLSTLRDENLDLRVHTYHLQQEVSRLETRLSLVSKRAASGRQEAMSESRKQYQTLLKELEESEQENKLLKENENAFECKLRKLETQVNSLSEENETLQERLKMSTSLVSELEGSVVEWSKRVKALSAEVCSLREINEGHQALLRDYEKDKQNSAKQLDDCSSQMISYTSELRLAIAERDEAKQLLEAARTNNSRTEQLEAELRNVRNKLYVTTETVREQEITIEVLTADKTALTEKLADMKLAIIDLECEVKSLHKTVDDKDEELQKSKGVIETVELLQQEVNNLQGELNTTRTTLAEQEETINTLTLERNAKAGRETEVLQKLKCAESEVQKLSSELCACESVLIERNTKLLEQQRQLSNLECERTLGLVRAVSSGDTRPQKHDEALQKSLEVKTSQLTRAQEDIKILTSQIATQNMELEAYQSLELEYQQFMMQADSQALQKVSNQLKSWARQNAALQVEVQALQKTNDRLALDLRLTQKSLQDSANASAFAQRGYSKQVQELTHGRMQQEVLAKELTDQTEQLQAEVAALRRTRLAVVERNALLEKCNTNLLRELHGVKARVQHHEQQIQASESRAGAVADQLQECRRLLAMVWRDVQHQANTPSGCYPDSEGPLLGRLYFSKVGLPRAASGEAGLQRHFKEREAELQQQLRTYRDEQVKLISLVGVLNSEIQSLQQRKECAASVPVHNSEALHSIVQKLLQDLERTAALSNRLQQSLLTANTSLTARPGCASLKEESSDVQEEVGVGHEQLATLRREKEWLVSEVAMLKRLREEAVAEVAALKEQLLGANRKLQTLQRKMFQLTKERDQFEAEVKDLDTAYVKLKQEYDLLIHAGPRGEVTQVQELGLMYVQVLKEVQSIGLEKEVLLQKLEELQQVNAVLCEQLQMLPTRETDYTTLETSDGSFGDSSQ